MCCEDFWVNNFNCPTLISLNCLFPKKFTIEKFLNCYEPKLSCLLVKKAQTRSKFIFRATYLPGTPEFNNPKCKNDPCDSAAILCTLSKLNQRYRNTAILWPCVFHYYYLGSLQLFEPGWDFWTYDLQTGLRLSGKSH